MTLNFWAMVLELVQYVCGAVLVVGVCVELWRQYHGENPYERAARELEQKLAPKPKPESETENETS
jgi:hypothetical protein